MENNEMEVVNNQLKGFELDENISSEQLAQNYEALFTGIESSDIDEFRSLLGQAPDNVQAEIKNGKTDTLYEHLTGILKWNKKRAMQMIAFALISVTTSSAFASGKEDVFADMETVQARKDVRIQSVQGGGDSREKGIMSSDISVNGSVAYQDEDGTWGNEHSRSEQDSDGSSISVGTIRK